MLETNLDFNLQTNDKILFIIKIVLDTDNF